LLINFLPCCARRKFYEVNCMKLNLKEKGYF
jgi:hypothetical protein